MNGSNGQSKFLEVFCGFQLSVCVCCPSNALRQELSTWWALIPTLYRPCLYRMPYHQHSKDPPRFFHKSQGETTISAPPKSMDYRCPIWVDVLPSLGGDSILLNIWCTPPPSLQHITVVCHLRSLQWSPKLLDWHCRNTMLLFEHMAFILVLSRQVYLFRFGNFQKTSRNNMILQLLQRWHPKKQLGWCA